MQYCNIKQIKTFNSHSKILWTNLVRQQLQRERRQGHVPPPLPVLLVQERVRVGLQRGEGRREVEEAEEVGPDVHGLVVETEQAVKKKKIMYSCLYQSNFLRRYRDFFTKVPEPQVWFQ